MRLRDVAVKAKVSVATVSRVLNDSGPVKRSTRTRVLRVARELHYYQNLLARSLAKGENRCLGMVASNLENPFFHDILVSLESIASMRGYEVVVAKTYYQPSELVPSVRLMMGRRVAGLALIAPELNPALLHELEDSGLPVAVCGTGKATDNISIIAINYVNGMHRVVRYLRSLGHRRLARVCRDMAVGSAMERKMAFLDVMRHFPEVEYTVVADGDGPQGGQQATRQLLASGFRPTAIISANDYMALGVLRAVREHGLRVPEELSVTGYDNVTLSEFACPPLTTIDVPRNQIGRMVFEALVADDGESQRGGRMFLIDPELVVRESTGPVRAQEEC
jgi:DNA-binding LacI/PurR family transcriptional regulator